MDRTCKNFLMTSKMEMVSAVLGRLDTDDIVIVKDISTNIKYNAPFNDFDFSLFMFPSV